MKILVIAAHPDDEVYGMGGTIAKLTKQGHELYVLIITEGCSTQYKDRPHLIREKKKQAYEANAVLGVKEVIFGDLPDMKLDTVAHVKINAVIEKAIRDLKPNVVYTHFYGDVNKDHRCVSESTMVAVRPIHLQCVREVYFYQVPSSTEWAANVALNTFTPNVFEEISKYYDRKQAAILAYSSEIREYPHPRSLKVVEMYDLALAKRNGLELAEGFMLIRKVNK
ncbi:MAG: PIG-L family deacetylase [Firmicutes bacterium]|nr:PIG-L family deacetylase [Bacillota bacterium]